MKTIHRDIDINNISMNALSEEQTVVLNHTKSGHNSVVDAVAGSGSNRSSNSVNHPDHNDLKSAQGVAT